MSNILKFPFAVSRRAFARLPRTSKTGTPKERGAGQCTGANMHTVVFRSYGLILASSEADLVRDVGLDVDKARTKLRKIREQIERDREDAAARATMLSIVEAKLEAAIGAVHSK